MKCCNIILYLNQYFNCGNENHNYSSIAVTKQHAKMEHCAKNIFNPCKDFENIEIFENFSYHTVQCGELNFGTNPNLKY